MFKKPSVNSAILIKIHLDDFRFDHHREEKPAHTQTCAHKHWQTITRKHRNIEINWMCLKEYFQKY